jgi:hypothetical protein
LPLLVGGDIAFSTIFARLWATLSSFPNRGSFLLALVLLTQSAAPAISPELHIEAPQEWSSVRTRLESFDRQRLSDVALLVGITAAGPPIRVTLLPESSDVARATPSWIAGFAMGNLDTIVLFPSRSPSYPNATLEDVLRHELAHILIHRAAGGRPIPRWFNEGLAMTAEHGWRFRDQTQLLFQLVSGPRHSLGELNRLFESGQDGQARAYLLSAALVRELLHQHGQTAAATILQKVGHGDSFDQAFISVTGISPDEADSRFWNSQRVWTTWVSILFSNEVLWIAVTLLALLAIQRRRRKNAEIERKWEEEERRHGNGVE